MLRFSCARCGAPLTASEERIGARVACPRCDHEQTVSDRAPPPIKPDVKSPSPLLTIAVGAMFLLLVGAGVIVRRCNAPRVEDLGVIAGRHTQETLRAQIRLRKESGHFERIEIHEELQIATIWVGDKFRELPIPAQQESLRIVRDYLAGTGGATGKPIVIVRDVVTDEVTHKIDEFLREE